MCPKKTRLDNAPNTLNPNTSPLLTSSNHALASSAFLSGSSISQSGSTFKGTTTKNGVSESRTLELDSRPPIMRIEKAGITLSFLAPTPQSHLPQEQYNALNHSRNTLQETTTRAQAMFEKNTERFPHTAPLNTPSNNPQNTPSNTPSLLSSLDSSITSLKNTSTSLNTIITKFQDTKNTETRDAFLKLLTHTDRSLLAPTSSL